MNKKELLEQIRKIISRQLSGLHDDLWDEVIQYYQDYIADEIDECLDNIEIEDNTLNNQVKEIMNANNVAKISSAIESTGLRVVSINRVEGQYIIKAN